MAVRGDAARSTRVIGARRRRVSGERLRMGAAATSEWVPLLPTSISRWRACARGRTTAVHAHMPMRWLDRTLVSVDAAVEA